jgi:hypothetical protein
VIQFEKMGRNPGEEVWERPRQYKTIPIDKLMQWKKTLTA